jgi:hypothetical protein
MYGVIDSQTQSSDTTLTDEQREATPIHPKREEKAQEL